jgi:hypothetical protein
MIRVACPPIRMSDLSASNPFIRQSMRRAGPPIHKFILAISLKRLIFVFQHDRSSICAIPITDIFGNG